MKFLSMKGKYFLSIQILFISLSSVFANAASPTIDIDNIYMKVELKGKSLIFTVENHGQKNLLIADDFCFDLKARNVLLDLPNLKVRKDNFSNGIAGMQGRMAILKANGSRTCAVSYFENSQEKTSTKSNGLILWNTNLFIGDIQDGYASKKISGVLPVSFPVGGDNASLETEVDELSLTSYKLRKGLGIIQD